MTDPSSLAGKVLWLRAKDLGASGSSVATWADQSGLGHNATAPGTAPTVATASTPLGGKSVRLSSSGLNLPGATVLGVIYAPYTATASTFYDTGASFPASNLMDGSTATAWVASSSAMPQWVKYEINAGPTIATSYTLRADPSVRPYFSTWTFEGSNDDASWTTLDSRSGITFSGSTAQTFSFSNSTAYRFYRLNASAKAGSGVEVGMSEWSLSVSPPGLVQNPGEMWIVVKSDGTTGPTAWEFGTDASTSHYPYSGVVYDDFGNSTRRSFTPSLAVTDWRIYRVGITDTGSGLGTWFAELDGVSQSTASGATRAWNANPVLAGSFAGNMAEVILFNRSLDSTEASGLYAYLRAEHFEAAPTSTVTITAPSPTVAISGIAPTTGTVTATPAAPVVSVTGDVPGAITGTVQATAPAPVILVSGDVPEPIAGTVTATAPAPVVRVQDAPASLLLGGFKVGGDLVSDTIDLAAQTLAGGFTLGSTLTSRVVALQTLTGGFRIGSMLRQARDWGIDARSSRPRPRVTLAHRDGTPICELQDAQIAPLSVGPGILDSWTFGLDNDDAKAGKVESVAVEAQLWRGSVLMSKGPIGTGSDSGGRTTYPVSDPRWYLWDNRVIGRLPKLNLLPNGDFHAGLAAWRGGFDAGSAPEANPKVSIVDEAESTSGKGLLLEGVDKVVTTKVDIESPAVFVPNTATYLSGGEAKVQAVGATIPNGATVRITGFTANDGTGDGLTLSLHRAQAAKATLAAMGKGFVFKLPSPLRTPNANDGVVAGRGYYEPIATNATEAGRRLNRRVSIAYEGVQTAVGHRQFEWAWFPIRQDPSEKVPLDVVVAGRMRIVDWLGAPKDGWAMRVSLILAGVVIDTATASMSEATPRQRWFDYSATISAPPDGKTYVIRVDLYPPAGQSIWVDVRAEPQEQLGFFDVDRATIVRDIVRHVQDPAYGHGDLGIGTRCALTGMTTTKEYAFAQRWKTQAAIEQVTSLARGLDVDCEVTPTSATIVTHYPRQGGASGLTLAHGRKGIVTTYKALPARSASLASVIIAQAWGISSARPERIARDNTALGGTQLEQVIDADAETPLVELGEVADSALARSIHPRAAWEVALDPGRTSDVLDSLGKGDTCMLVLLDEGVRALHRVVTMTWDPATDGLTLQLAPEEV